jgi:hypothetical protein
VSGAGYTGVAYELAVNIRGLPEVERAFRDKESSVRARVLDALMGLGREVADGANTRAPGHLAGTVTVRPRSRWDNFVAVAVRSREKVAYYVEFGQQGLRRPVSSHTRRGKLQSFVWPVKFRKKSTKIKFGKFRVGATTTVKAYTRVFRNQKNPFLGAAFEAVQGRLEQRTEGAVADALRDG